MKSLILFTSLFLLILPTRSGAQYLSCESWDSVTFDHSDTTWRNLISIDTVNYHHNIWQVGSPHKTIFDSALSYPNAIVTDTLNPYASNDTSVFTFTFSGQTYGIGTPCYIIGASFYYALNIDSASVAQIDFSPDSGRTWINLKDSIPAEVQSITPLTATPGWNHWEMNLQWYSRYTFNDSLKLRFTFISDSNTSGKEGWIMDNFFVHRKGPESVPTIQNNNQINVFPNPAFTEINISATTNNIKSVTILNILGQPIYTHEYNTKQVIINVADLTPGLYLIKISDTEMRKFLKQ